MNRAHDSKQALTAVYSARKIGFQNLNVDLIYGIHSPKHNRWISDLEKLAELRPEHISAYCLTIEPNTVFGKWLKKRRIKPVNDDFSAKEFEILRGKLMKLDYVHYEVSNFCLTGKESKHNSGYWRNQKYLGIGPGAHSYDNDYRHFNISNNAIYIKSIEDNKLPSTKEKLTKEEKTNEYLLTSLRTHWGVSMQYLKDNFGFNILEHKGEYLEELNNQGFIEIKDDYLVLTPAGFLLADKISSDLFV
jgi:oxygen-independent coproporphyrinogen-3 oxidase